MDTLSRKTGTFYYVKVFLVLVMLGGRQLKLCQSYPFANEQVDSSFQHGNILSPLLKALSEHEPWGELTPRTRPESRYVRYMKRLYKISSKQERNHEVNHLYNTVRLITPRDECLEQSNEYFVQDLSYSLDRVRVQEHLLKSVLLYSFDQDQASTFISYCYLDVKEQVPPVKQLCSSSYHSLRFHIQARRRSRPKWIEVDVTSLLHPLIKSHKKDIHLLINLTCVDDGQTSRHHELSIRSPSLLLYLNDTSELAYQRGQTSARLGGTFEDQPGSATTERHVSRRRRRNERGSEPEPSQGAYHTDLFLNFDFPKDDCNLYDFRVSFSQLKLDHWIIAPHKYNPRYCKGTCPRLVGYMYGSPVHTMVQNIIYEKLDSSVPRPSCVPSEYNPLSVLTIENDGSIAYKEYEEMIATKCSCR